MNTIFVKLEFADGTVGRMQAFVDSEDDVPAIIAKSIFESPVVRWAVCAATDFPASGVFRDAWRMVGNSVVIDLAAAKEIAHCNRRAARATEFAPLDIQSTVPHLAITAEAARQKIRERYAALQIAMDAATSVDELTTLLL